jgi:4-amino-4-deoxy-L-arabinose transferase-like glycosyltransferase
MFELVPTKLPHYILPAYPPLVMLAVVWVFARPASTGSSRALRIASSVLFGLGLAVFAAVTWFAPQRWGDGASTGLVAIALAGAALGAVAPGYLLKNRRPLALAAAIAAAILLLPLLTAGVAPRLAALWISPRAAALAAQYGRNGDTPPVIAGYVEPSLVFLLGTQTRLADTGAEAANLAGGGLALIEARERSAFLDRLAALGARATVLGTIDGFDYSRGRAMHITLYRVARE